MSLFNGEETERIAAFLGLSERAAIGTCIMSGACAAPIYLAATNNDPALTPMAVLIQAFAIPLAAGLGLVWKGEGGLTRWYASLRDNPLVLALVGAPALVTYAIVATLT